MKKFILSTVIIAFAISCLITSCSQDEDWGMDEYSTLAGRRMTRSGEGNGIEPKVEWIKEGHDTIKANTEMCPYLTNVSVNLTWDRSMVALANAHLSISVPDGTRPAYKLNGGYFTIIPLSSHRFSATVPIQYYVFTYDGNYVDSIRYNGSLLIDYECDNDMFFYASPINPNTSNN